MEWMLLPLRRYAEFTGRSRRKEFWLFCLFQLLIHAVIGVVFGTADYSGGGAGGMGFFGMSTMITGTGGKLQSLFNLAVLIPNIAVTTRRLHDVDRSGWFQLLWFVPILGWFTLLVMFCLDGNRGFNRYGPDPKNPMDVDAFN